MQLDSCTSTGGRIRSRATRQLHIVEESHHARAHRHRVHQPGRARLRHLLEAARQPDHLPRHPDRRHQRQPRHRPAPAPRVGVDEQGHLALHQLAGRRHERLVRHPRHDALRRPRHRHDLRRSGRVGGRRAPRRRHAGQALRTPQRPGADPPAPRRRPGTVHRPRAADRRGRRDAPPDGRHPRGGHRADAASGSPRTSTATTSCGARTPWPTGSSTRSSTAASSRTPPSRSPPEPARRRAGQSGSAWSRSYSASSRRGARALQESVSTSVSSSVSIAGRRTRIIGYPS